MRIILSLVLLLSLFVYGCDNFAEDKNFNKLEFNISGEEIASNDADLENQNAKASTITNLKEFNECLSSKGVVIYGANTCPACNSLVNTLGGYDAVESVYVECTLQGALCSENKMTRFVPEIHVNGELYSGSRTLQALSSETGCALPSNA